MSFLVLLLRFQFPQLKTYKWHMKKLKSLLLDGDYKTALEKINEAKAQIEADVKLDPNQTFSMKLLPALETNASKSRAHSASTGGTVQSFHLQAGFLRICLRHLRVCKSITNRRKSSVQGIHQKTDSLLNTQKYHPNIVKHWWESRWYKILISQATTVVMQKLSDRVMQLTPLSSILL